MKIYRKISPDTSVQKLELGYGRLFRPGDQAKGRFQVSSLDSLCTSCRSSTHIPKSIYRNLATTSIMIGTPLPTNGTCKVSLILPTYILIWFLYLPRCVLVLICSHESRSQVGFQYLMLLPCRLDLRVAGECISPERTLLASL